MCADKDVGASVPDSNWISSNKQWTKCLRTTKRQMKHGNSVIVWAYDVVYFVCHVVYIVRPVLG